MAEAQSVVRGRGFARLAAKGAGFVIAWMAGLVAFAACQTPHTFAGYEPEVPPVPRFEIEDERFITFDGAELGLTVWEAAEETLVDGAQEIVIVGLHGMNDYANAFHMAAPYWAERGVTTYAYDQRGFGRSAGRGEWPEEEDMREDLRAAVDVVRGKHPEAVLAVVGISMGGAVTMSAFGSDRPPVGVDRVVFSGPGLRGWGSIPLVQQAALWISARVRPGWDVRPPRFVKIEPSDNVEMLQRLWSDPLGLRQNDISQVHGVVSVMESAHDAAAKLPGDVPMLLTYGARDIVIPERGVKRTAKVMAPHVRTAYYPEGYHMLLRDLQAETVFEDVLAFLRDPEAELPSGVGEVPGRD
ncbi:MAG: alpha/beta fold hydrolase [Pseudomonadota bacterium]